MSRVVSPTAVVGERTIMPRWALLVVWWVVGVVVTSYCSYQACRRGEEEYFAPDRLYPGAEAWGWVVGCAFWPLILIHYVVCVRNKPITDGPSNY